MTYYAPAIISAIEPASGPIHGMTWVQLQGGPFIDMFHESLCRVGRWITASVVSDMHTANCLMPPAALACADDIEFYDDFSPMLPYSRSSPVLTWHGCAAVRNGVLSFSPTADTNSGFVRINLPFCDDSFMQSFSLSVIVRTDQHAHGVGIFAGTIPIHNFDEQGWNNGLNVRIVGGEARVQILYERSIVWESNRGFRKCLNGEIKVTMDWGSLSVHCGEQLVLSTFQLVAWQPSKLWSLGVKMTGSGEEYGAIERMKLQVGASVTYATSRLQMAINGQQYTVGPMAFSYYSEPIVSFL